MKKAVRFLSTCSLLLALPGAHSKEIPDAYVYIGWPLDEMVILSRPTTTDPRSILSNGPGDAIAELRYCDQKSEFYCFVSSAFTFSVPKRWRPEEKSWEYEAHRFEVIQDGFTVQFFGCSTSDVALIRAVARPDSEDARFDETFFYYSKTHGLLGFGFIPSLSSNKRRPNDVVMRGGCGWQTHLVSVPRSPRKRLGEIVDGHSRKAWDQVPVLRFRKVGRRGASTPSSRIAATGWPTTTCAIIWAVSTSFLERLSDSVATFSPDPAGRPWGCRSSRTACT